MKYKDRKHAKRKYKQALLATVATMTLGVSTLGSAASAFAAENKANIQQARSASTTDEPVIKKEKDGSFTVLKDKIFSKKTLKAIGSLGGPTLKQAYADSQVDGGNFKNTFRTLAMGSAALIPYGGVVISPLIGLLWAEDQTAINNQLKELMNKIANQTHGQIAEFDKEGLGTELHDLKEKLEEFENLVNNKSSYYSNDQLTPKMNIQNKAIKLNDLFRTVIAHCQKPSYKDSELPMYIILSTAHMNFMNFIKEHGKSLLHFDDKVLHDEFLAANKQKKYTEEYVGYATSFAKKDLDSASTLVNKDIPWYLYQKLPNADALGTVIIKKLMRLSIQNMSTSLEETLNKSINNIAFKQAAGIKSEWTLDQNGRTLYYNLNGQMQTGWKEISTSFATKYDQGPNEDRDNPLTHESLKELIPYSWYYFSPEKTDKFEKGEMYSDTTQTLPDGKTYQFDLDGKCLNPDGGKPTGWAHLKDGYSYFSPADGTKNHDGKTFNKGEIMTGWVKLNGDYFYFSPADGTKNDDSKTFNKGAMMTGWVQVPESHNSWFYLDNEAGNKNFQQITGRMLTGDNNGKGFELKNKKGKYVKHTFNSNGTLDK